MMVLDQPTALAFCIGCGCHDEAACWDDEAGQPCHWLRLERDARIGVCSACDGVLFDWDQGQRSPDVPIDVLTAEV